MPPGAKKRKALKKKQQQQQQQEAIGTNTNDNGDKLHGGNEEHGSQDDRESDSNLSSPGSQGNQEFDGTQDPSAAMVKKDTDQEMSDAATQGVVEPRSGNSTAVERGTDNKKKSPFTSYENGTQTAKDVASHDLSVKEIAPVVDSEKSEHAETPSTKSDLVKQKEIPSGKMDTNLPGSAAGASKMVESVRESEVPLSPEEKGLLLPGPSPAVRTSWLSCCGLFDAMTGSDR
ncbi:hypothetical protein HA466_0280220 [Hirschfeldia incana]|nr:hypothetical protein HA466_0280220 [Hirschfeldia incana]KAJ0233672.1 hypothetical protein HA466_0280220 [Hirschfeldia incana]